MQIKEWIYKGKGWNIVIRTRENNKYDGVFNIDDFYLNMVSPDMDTQDEVIEKLKEMVSKLHLRAFMFLDTDKRKFFET